MTDRPQDPPRDQVGSVGEEAVKLLGVLADWAADSSGGRVGGLAQQLDEHLDTGAPECRLCPICRAVHVVREAGPEVRVHLASAAASLMQAAAGLLAAAAQDPQPPGRPGPVQHIDVDGDEEAPA